MYIYIYVYIYIYTQCNGESYVIEKQSILNYTYTHNHQESISFYSFLCVSSFSRRRLVLELMAFNDLQCRGSRLCRVTQLQQMRRELRKLSELRENAGIHGEGVLEPVFFRGNLSEILRETMENMGFSMNA